jgi:ribonuclease VapC
MIVDTSAVVAILYGEPEVDDFTQCIHDADRCLISAGTFVELSIVLATQADADAELQCQEFFRAAGIVIEPFTVHHAWLAREGFRNYGKGRHPAGLNFGDCFAYALAKATGEPLLFKGNDFRQTDIISATP